VLRDFRIAHTIIFKGLRIMILIQEWIYWLKDRLITTWTILIKFMSLTGNFKMQKSYSQTLRKW